MQNQSSYFISEQFTQWKRLLFFAFLILTVIISISDLVFLKINYTQASFYPYLFDILIVTFIFIGILIFKRSLYWGNFIQVYCIFFSLLVAELLKPQNEYFEALLMRDIIFNLIIMIIGALFIGRKHIIILSCAFVITYITKAFITDNPFLWTNSYNILLAYLTISTLLYILVYRLQKYYVLNEKYINELSQMNKTKDLFFSVLAHDLRNPFHTLLGLNEAVRSKLSEGNIDKAEFLLSKMEETTNKTFQLLDNLLIWSYSESGKIQYNPEQIDFKEIILENINFFEHNLKTKNINIKLQLQENNTILADRNMMSAVIRNLLSNAIKFSPVNEEIKMTSSWSDHSFRFDIADKGKGIDKKYVPTLFNLANKHTSRGTMNETGTGFGLAICKDFISKHEGRIWVESNPPNGTSFIFSIPE